MSVGEGRAAVAAGPAAEPDLILTSDYPTAAAVAAGTLAAETALAEGRIRVKGDLSQLSARQAVLAGVDPVPVAVRAATTY